MELKITTSALIIFIALFFGVGIIMTVRTMLAERKAHAKGAPHNGIRGLISQRVGPVTPERAPLNAPLRVMLEFICSLFGFPGLGWSLSTRLAPGVVMMLAGPIFCWMLWPMILYHTGVLAADPYAIIKELPIIAGASAGTLAVLEARAAGGRRRGRPAA